MNTDRTQITSLCNPTGASLLATPKPSEGGWEARPNKLKASPTHYARFGGQAGRRLQQSVTSKVSVFSYELLNLAYDAIEFVDEI